MRRPWLTILVLSFCRMAYGQDLAVDAGCTRDAAFYESKYRLAEDVELTGGFAFLRSIRLIADPGPELRKGAVFRIQPLLDMKNRLQMALSTTATEGFHFSVVRVILERCSPSEGDSGELHAVLQVFDSNPAGALFRRFESRDLESSDAATAAQTERPRSWIRFQPRVGFNASDRFMVGGLATVAIPGGPVQSLSADGAVSSESNFLNVNLSGERDFETGLLQSATWRFGYQYSTRPSETTSLRDGIGYGQLSLITQPLGATSSVLRFAVEAAGGNAQSDLSQSDLPANTLASSANYTLKTAFGITGRSGRHSFTASYGLQLGHTTAGRAIDYHKHIIDTAVSTYALVGDHRLIEYDTRFTAGFLQAPGMAPATQRFFGGNRETSFFSSPEDSYDWKIRSNPFLRGIPANEFNRVEAGPITGGDQFLTWNNTLTLPFPFLNYPLLPNEVTSSQAFKDALDTQRSANRSALIVSYTADDPASKAAAEHLPAVGALLDKARALMNQLAGASGPAQAEAKSCGSNIGQKRGVVDEAAEAMAVVVDESDPDSVIPSVRECLKKVQALQADPGFDPLFQGLEAESKAIRDQLATIDAGKVEKLVNRDIALADRVMNVFFKEASIVSLQPIVVFDIAQMSGPASAVDPRTIRYAVGGGVRLQMLRAVNFSVGYAANPQRLPGESPGAFFFGMTFLDLFR